MSLNTFNPLTPSVTNYHVQPCNMDGDISERFRRQAAQLSASRSKTVRVMFARIYPNMGKAGRLHPPRYIIITASLKDRDDCRSTIICDLYNISYYR